MKNDSRIMAPDRLKPADKDIFLLNLCFYFKPGRVRSFKRCLLVFPVTVISLFLLLICSPGCYGQPSYGLKIQQLTFGPGHHFFGYIGQCQTIPWNLSGRYILGLEIDSIDRMPAPRESATIILIDTRDNYEIIRIEKTYAWNHQQGTMFYWNPLAPETQFFFNDRDTASGMVFTVLYDITKQKRVMEYRFNETPVGNSGVAPDGSAWIGLNYGRLARLRPVTGYPGALDWSKDEIAPESDGIFMVDMETGKNRLLVSFQQLEKKLKEHDPELEHDGLFINHTLWNRNNGLVYFFVRAGWNGQGGKRINIPFSVRADGTGLTMHDIYVGGHPEWAEDNLLIGKQGKNQVLYDVDRKMITGQLGNPEIFPDPEGDISLSPDGNLLVNGYKMGTENFYTVFRRSDGIYVRSEGISRGIYTGDVRIDPAPQWNRTSDAVLVPGVDEKNTRQMFLIKVIPRGEGNKNPGR